MRFRTFAWLAAAIVVIAGNTTILLWRKAGRGPGPGRGGAATSWAPTRVEEQPAFTMPVDAAAVARASAGGARLRVVVRGPGETPVPGARVRVTGDRPGTWSPFPVEALAAGFTGEDGAVDLVLPRRASLRVSVECEGFAAGERPALEGEVRVDLIPEAVVRVRLVDDATGAPLPGVALRAESHVPVVGMPRGTVAGVTDADGVCTFRGMWGGDVTVFATSPSRQIAQAGLRRGASEPIEIRLQREFRLRGRVVVPGFDRKVTEGRISVGFAVPDHRAVAREGPVAAPIDGEGRFTLGGFESPPRSPYFLRVETGGQAYRAQGQIPKLDPATGEQVGEIQVPIPGNNPDAAFSGTVRDEEGRPVAGALVLLGSGLTSGAVRWMKSELELDEAWTDGAGAWRLLPRYIGTGYRELLVLHPDFAPQLVELPQRLRRKVADAVLGRGVTAVVTVRDAAGRPVVGAEVSAQMRHPRPDRAWQEFGDVQGAMRAGPRTGPDGVAVLGHLGLGSWHLVARSADDADGARVLVETRPNGKDLAVSITLAPLPVVRGTIRVRGGSLPHGASVLVPGRSPMDFLRLPVDGRGAFQSPPLDIPACLVVDGRIPIFAPDLRGPGEVIGLAEPGVPIEIEVDPPPAPRQAR